MAQQALWSTHMMRAVEEFCEIAGVPRPTDQQAEDIRSRLLGEKAKDDDIFMGIIPTSLSAEAKMTEEKRGG